MYTRIRSLPARRSITAIEKQRGGCKRICRIERRLADERDACRMRPRHVGGFSLGGGQSDR
jgi:hypothetical protein